MIKLRVLLIGLAAISVAASAAFFSVSGLSKLFAGATLSVTIMAASLEFSKLVAASFLHTYWNKVNTLLKIYLTTGVVVLILITSIGIYGFLTSAYQVTADELNMLNKEVGVVELKKQRFEEQLEIYNKERSDISNGISELSKGMSNNVVQYTDKAGNLVTTQSNSNRQALERQLDDAKQRRDAVSLKIEALVDSITALDISIIEKQNSTDVAAEIGPLRYLSELTGLPMNTIVNWFTLLIVFVFDPLAVSLLIAYNAANKIEKDANPYTERRHKREYKEDATVDSGDVVDVEPNYFTQDANDIDFDRMDASTLSLNPHSTDTNVVLEDEVMPTINFDAIDVDDDGVVDGYDTDDDGLVDELTEEGRNLETLNTPEPHYTDPDFDWSDRRKWINNQNAINYYLNHVKNKGKNDRS